MKAWVAERDASIKCGNKRVSDDEQVAAVAAVNGHVHVVARAGSGKTTTLVNRAHFLLTHCGVAPSEMLLLAFNRKASVEIRRRLLALLYNGAETVVAADVDRRIRETGKPKRIDRDDVEADAVDHVARKLNLTLPHVMTFHALAYRIVHPEETLLYNAAVGESQGLSRALQQVIDDHLQIPTVKDQIRELMLAHFREDWDRIVEGCYDKSKEDLLRFRRSLPRECLNGDYVKSFGEKVIADFLFEHDVDYKYERNHWWSGVNYRPDFTVFQTPRSGTIIEYFGLQGDSDYDEMSKDKRAYWDSKQDWTLIELSPVDIMANGVDSFLVDLKKRLEGQGIRCVRLPEDEIWHRVRGRAIDRFTTAIVGFIGRCRKQSLSPSELRSLIDSYLPLSPVEVMFLKLAQGLYVAYLDRLSATGEEDFDGLMQRAVDAISDGQTLFQRTSGSGDLTLLRYVGIDEFQDFSDLFYRVLGDSPEKITKEERRLFYVALTRAVETLVIITDGRSKSPFLQELEHKRATSPIKWQDYPPLRGTTTRLVVKVGNQDRRGRAPTFAIKDLLKSTGYQWQSTGWAGWAKSFPADGFAIEKIKEEVWAEPADGIEVRIFDDTETLTASFLIDAGHWKQL